MVLYRQDVQAQNSFSHLTELITEGKIGFPGAETLLAPLSLPSPHCSAHPVQIGVRIFWHVVVEDNIDALDVHSSSKEISCHQDPPLEVLELLIARQPAREEGQRGRGNHNHHCSCCRQNRALKLMEC